MTGQHLARLEHAKAGAEPVQLAQSMTAWLDGATSLDAVRQTLTSTAVEVERGFSEGVSGADDGTAKTARRAIEKLRDDVVIPRGVQMQAASAALSKASKKLNAVKNTDVPADPGDAPKRPSAYGTIDDIDAIRADRAYDNALSRHKGDVSDYGDADEVARKKLEALDKAYAEASAIFQEIHGEPVYPEDLPPGGETGPGGFPGAPIPGGRPPGAVPIRHPEPPPIHIPGGHPGDDGGPHPIHPGPVGGTIGGPDHGPGSGPGSGPGYTGGSGTGSGSSGGGFGINPVLGGGLAAGVFGGPGIVNAVKGALGGRGGFGSSSGTIGSTSRAGGPGSLGRSGGGTGTGSPVSRAGGRGAGGGAGGGRGAGGRGVGAAGAAGGRKGGGGRGGAGGAGAGTGGRGRKGRDKDGADRDLFDDGADWLDDEGAGPDVLG